VYTTVQVIGLFIVPGMVESITGRDFRGPPSLVTPYGFFTNPVDTRTSRFTSGYTTPLTTPKIALSRVCLSQPSGAPSPLDRRYLHALKSLIDGESSTCYP
jgi:hypothetical protein